jgi:replicative DNA helicase
LQEEHNETENTTHEPIPFSDHKQAACLGYILYGEGPTSNRNFFLKAQLHIKPEWFAEPFCQKIYAAATTFFKKFNRPPSIKEVEESDDFKRMDQGYRNKVTAKILECKLRMGEYGLDLIKAELTDWLHVLQIKKKVYEIQNHFNNRKTDKIVSTLQEAAREVKETNFEDNKAIAWDDFSVFDRQEEELENALTFGIDGFDRLLNPAAQSGSLLRGDTTVVLAPSNIGKTTTLITVAAANVLRNKNVLFLSHEGRGEDLTEKFWCCLLRVSKPQLHALRRQYGTDPLVKERLNSVMNYLKNHLTYLPMNKPGLRVEDVATEIARLQKERIENSPDHRGYDLLVDDYPAKLSSAIMQGKEAARRHNDEYVYSYFVQIALDNNFHCLNAIQTNREGSKVNRGDEDRLLQMEDVSESWGPMTSATNVITINRTPDMEKAGYVTYNICKSRSSDRGWAVACRSRYDLSTTHSNELGCTWYRGGTTMDAKIDSLLAKFEGVEIPYSETRK